MNRYAGSRILIVDDEPDLRELFQFELEGAGFKVFVAESGVEAYRILSAEPIDLVLSDLRMPGGNGMDLLGRIRDLDAEHPPVILMTGSTNLTEADVVGKGAQRILMKPFDRKTLMIAIEECLDSAASRPRTRPQSPPQK